MKKKEVEIPENLLSRIICESFFSTTRGESLMSLAMCVISTQLWDVKGGWTREGKGKEEEGKSEMW